MSLIKTLLAPVQAFALAAGLSGCANQKLLSSIDSLNDVIKKDNAAAYEQASLEGGIFRDMDFGKPEMPKTLPYALLPTSAKFLKKLSDAIAHGCTLIPRNDKSYVTEQWDRYCGSSYSLSGLYLNNYVLKIRHDKSIGTYPKIKPQPDKEAVFRFMG